jgi:hypothetical protein
MNMAVAAPALVRGRARHALAGRIAWIAAGRPILWRATAGSRHAGRAGQRSIHIYMCMTPPLCWVSTSGGCAPIGEHSLPQAGLCGGSDQRCQIGIVGVLARKRENRGARRR